MRRWIDKFIRRFLYEANRFDVLLRQILSKNNYLGLTLDGPQMRAGNPVRKPSFGLFIGISAFGSAAYLEMSAAFRLNRPGFRLNCPSYLEMSRSFPDNRPNKTK